MSLNPEWTVEDLKEKLKEHQVRQKYLNLNQFARLKFLLQTEDYSTTINGRGPLKMYAVELSNQNYTTLLSVSSITMLRVFTKWPMLAYFNSQDYLYESTFSFLKAT